MIINQRDKRTESAIAAGHHMMTAARTAPKGKGVDIIEIALVDGTEREVLAQRMELISEQSGLKFFLRDAENVRHADAILFIGTRDGAQGLNCGHCGYDKCIERSQGVPCAINSIDVGIAIGSACAMAADLRVDTRVMFSAGLAAEQLAWLGDGVRQVMAILISIGSKNPFFDRQSRR